MSNAQTRYRRRQNRKKESSSSSSAEGKAKLGFDDDTAVSCSDNHRGEIAVGKTRSRTHRIEGRAPMSVEEWASLPCLGGTMIDHAMGVLGVGRDGLEEILASHDPDAFVGGGLDFCSDLELMKELFVKVRHHSAIISLNVDLIRYAIKSESAPNADDLRLHFCICHVNPEGEIASSVDVYCRPTTAVYLAMLPPLSDPKINESPTPAGMKDVFSVHEYLQRCSNIIPKTMSCVAGRKMIREQDICDEIHAKYAHEFPPQLLSDCIRLAFRGAADPSIWSSVGQMLEKTSYYQSKPGTNFYYSRSGDAVDIELRLDSIVD